MMSKMKNWKCIKKKMHTLTTQKKVFITYFSKKKKEFLESNDFLLLWQAKQDIEVIISGKSAQSTDKVVVNDGRYSLNIFLSER